MQGMLGGQLEVFGSSPRVLGQSLRESGGAVAWFGRFESVGDRFDLDAGRLGVQSERIGIDGSDASEGCEPESALGVGAADWLVARRAVDAQQAVTSIQQLAVDTWFTSGRHGFQIRVACPHDPLAGGHPKPTVTILQETVHTRDREADRGIQAGQMALIPVEETFVSGAHPNGSVRIGS